jgi:hypothetical protein
MTKTLNQIIFFPPPKSEYFFQQHWATLLLLGFTEPEAFLKISGKSFKNNLNTFGHHLV